MTDNNFRFDLSDRLIHFFREVDLEGNSAPVIQPEHFAFNSAVEGTKWPALFLLRCAVRSHRLWATWSVRGGVRTIYGPNPAVCFTEMPLAAFLESSATREAAGQAMSSYALTFPKAAMHSLGAMPVVYGLSDNNFVLPKGAGGGPRILPATQLPAQEQYRYVTFSPSGSYKVDWSHEREWRWPYTGDLSKIEEELSEYGIVSDAADIPGFDFSNPLLRGIGIIVKTMEDARKLKYDVLSLVDRGIVHRRHFDHMLILDQLPSADSLYAPEAVEAAIQRAMLDFAPFFNLDQADVSEIVSDFSHRVHSLEQAASHPPTRTMESGGCWLWFHDNTKPYVRALVQAGRVTVNAEGRYIASLDELNPARDLREREELTAKLASELCNELNVPGGSFSVLNSTNPDTVPFYIDREPKDDLYHNTDY
ncbi:DUF4427 domain-containing protein [Delftia lacustris]|uniref:DUF4427 domain-containing protein n=1 Tax=Delftia lacustris TaxID=558537 RepID=UPI0028577A09|nr:DUF4427 domain-containing protein [Delftia lacustris]MDR6731842.1 hypothetical protein [Delftia lacustris]